MQEQVSSNTRSSFYKRKREDRENVFNSEGHTEKRLSLCNSPVSKDFVDSSSSATSPYSSREILSEHDLNRCPESSLNKNARSLPLPELKWADSQRLWDAMCIKDSLSFYQRNGDLFSHHPALHPRMRSILLGWMTEVCEVYKMQRETYYLSVDYLDRYLSVQKDVLKSQLQLTGITCLFIAAKVEEIYPPKIAEFAYVTDGACVSDQIIEEELVILKKLNWHLSPMTVHSWLNLYLQICVNKTTIDAKNDSILQPSYSTKDFLQAAQLVDLCILDVNSLKYSYSVMAASSIHITLSCYKETVLFASGFQWKQISECVGWMRCFYQILSEDRSLAVSPSRFISANPMPNGVLDITYLLQTHSVDLKILERAQTQYQVMKQDTPHSSSSLLLTPPSSTNKKQTNYCDSKLT